MAGGVGNGHAALLDELRGLRWPARQPVPAGVPGAHRSRRRGTAVEFTEYRPYRQGDDPRRLDWKLLARTDRAYVRLTDDHAVLWTTIIVDASASMAYPTATLGKWRLACALAVGFASVAQASGDPVAVTIVSGEHVIGEVPRTTRRGVVATIAGVLGSLSPGPRAGSSTRLLRLEPGRLIVISDFLQESAVAIPERSEVYAVHIVAREELDPPRRSLLVSDPEDASIRRPLLPESRRAYLEAFGVWRETLRREWRSRGATYSLVATDEAPERAIRRVVRS